MARRAHYHYGGHLESVVFSQRSHFCHCKTHAQASNGKWLQITVLRSNEGSNWFYFDQDQRTGITLFFHPPTLLLGIQDSTPVVLKVWTSEQQEQHYLQTHQKVNFLEPYPKPTESEQLRGHPEVCVLTSLLGGFFAQIWEPLLYSLQWALERTPEECGQGHHWERLCSSATACCGSYLNSYSLTLQPISYNTRKQFQTV